MKHLLSGRKEVIRTKQEVWKDVVGYEGHYMVSNIGRVKSIPRYVSNHTGMLLVKERILKQRKDAKGYPRVYLSKNAHDRFVPVHRLVAMAFIENINRKPQVNHIDGNKENNHVENLEWCDNSENQLHAYRIGLNHVAENSGKPKRPVVQIEMKSGETVNEYSSISEAAKSVGEKSPSNIGECCKGRRKQVRGYIWRYKESEVM